MLRPSRPAAGGATLAQQARVLGLPAIARDEAQMDAVRVSAADHSAAQRDDGAGRSRRNSRQAPRESVRDRFRCMALENPAAVMAPFRNDALDVKVRGSRAKARKPLACARS